VVQVGPQRITEQTGDLVPWQASRICRPVPEKIVQDVVFCDLTVRTIWRIRRTTSAASKNPAGRMFQPGWCFGSFSIGTKDTRNVNRQLPFPLVLIVLSPAPSHHTYTGIPPSIRTKPHITAVAPRANDGVDGIEECQNGDGDGCAQPLTANFPGPVKKSSPRPSHRTRTGPGWSVWPAG